MEGISKKIKALATLLSFIFIFTIFSTNRSYAAENGISLMVNRKEAVVGNDLLIALERMIQGEVHYTINGQEKVTNQEVELEEEESGLGVFRIPLEEAGVYTIHSIGGQTVNYQVTVFNSMEEAYGQSSKLFVDIEEGSSVSVHNFQQLLTNIRAYDELGNFDEVLVQIPNIGEFTYYNDGLTSTITSDQPLDWIPGNYEMTVKYRQESITRKLTIYEDQISLSGEAELSLQAVDSVGRFSGKSRYETAVEIAKKSFTKADTVFLVSDNNFADALTAGSLAFAKNSPLLFAGGKTLQAETKKAIEQLGAKNIIIIGGSSGISDHIKTSLQKEGKVVERIAGKNRYMTALKVAKALREESHKDTVIIASGRNFPDALSIAPYAAKESFPILYTDGRSLDVESMKYIKTGGFKNAIIVGGTESVSGGISTQIQKTGIKVKRIAGESRYQTSSMIANQYFRGAKAATIANGLNYPDALVGGVFAAKKNAPVLLSTAEKLPEEVIKYIAAKEIEEVFLFGGKVSLSDELYEVIKNIQNQKLSGRKDNTENSVNQKPVKPVKPSGDRVMKVSPRNKGAQDWKGKDDSRAYAQLNKPVRILLDPGHGPGSKHNRGFIGGNEGDNNFYLAQELKTALEKKGFVVGMTRTKISHDPSLEKRGQMGAGYDLLISVHSNAISGKDTVRGTEVFDDVCWSNNELAKAIAQVTSKTFNHNNRGVKYRYLNNDKGNWYGVLRHSRATFAMLVENGFHTNPDDAALLRDPSFRKKLAEKQAQVIADYFNAVTFE